MKEEIKNRIDAESKDKRKLNDAELAQVTGGIVIPENPYNACNHNCSACNVSKCPLRDQQYSSVTF